MNSLQRIVLYIDDDEDDLMMVQETINEIDPNMIVRQANNGETGVQFLKQSKEFNDLPCLIILDINMPGMSGKEVLKEIKKDQKLSSIPMVLFTTSSSAMDKSFASKENVELITKPTSTTGLVDTVKKILDHCPPEAK